MMKNIDDRYKIIRSIYYANLQFTEVKYNYDRKTITRSCNWKYNMKHYVNQQLNGLN